MKKNKTISTSDSELKLRVNSQTYKQRKRLIYLVIKQIGNQTNFLLETFEGQLHKITSI